MAGLNVLLLAGVVECLLDRGISDFSPLGVIADKMRAIDSVEDGLVDLHAGSGLRVFEEVRALLHRRRAVDEDDHLFVAVVAELERRAGLDRDDALPRELDALLAAMPVTAGEARTYLARFLFRGDDVFKEVRLLSGGERSRLELALLGITPANLLLLDEPSSGLDAAESHAFGAVLRRLVDEEGIGILMVEHDMSLVLGICDWIFVLDFGRPLMEGTPAEVRGSEAVRDAYLGKSA